jgi:ribosome-binding protein aMBF1 (putative translation factor)
MSDLYEHIGQKIRELRTTYPRGALSQEGLSSKLKKSPNTISRWETGKYKPTPEDLDALARFFDVSIMVFFPQLHGENARVAMLTSATGGLDQNDFDEVIRYAEFRKARKALGAAKNPKKR